MERPEPANKGKIPTGRNNHRRKAAPSPQINPAPELLARYAKRWPKASPNREPSIIPRAGDVARSALPSAPPAPPTARPQRGPTQWNDLPRSSRCVATPETEDIDLSSP